MNRSELARQCGVDRSTVAQILSEDDGRVPNAHLAAECAGALGVSADWLLGLSERSETAAALLEASFRVSEADKTFADAQISAWHHESAGYKIRHVPTNLPDFLKTDAVLEYEYEAFLSKTPAQAISAMREQAAWIREPGSDYEVCCSLDQIETMLRGEGYWRDLSESSRLEQLKIIADRCDALYPALRLYFFDPRRVFSAPVTIFGPKLAVVYIGQHYLVFREKRQVQAFTAHFDQLIRAAEVDARRASDFLKSRVLTHK